MNVLGSFLPICGDAHDLNLLYRTTLLDPIQKSISQMISIEFEGLRVTCREAEKGPGTKRPALLVRIVGGSGKSTVKSAHLYTNTIFFLFFSVASHSVKEVVCCVDKNGNVSLIQLDQGTFSTVLSMPRMQFSTVAFSSDPDTLAISSLTGHILVSLKKLDLTSDCVK